MTFTVVLQVVGLEISIGMIAYGLVEGWRVIRRG